MREKERINRILNLLGLLWNKNPDYRFGQMLINNRIVPDNFNVWHNEDSGLEEYLQKLIKK
jgi:hypothetical protein